MRTITTIESLAMMTAIGCEELEALRPDFTPIMSASDRALMSLTGLGCAEIAMIEDIHPCVRRA